MSKTMPGREVTPYPMPRRRRWGWPADVSLALVYLMVAALCHEYLFHMSYGGSAFGEYTYYILAATVAIGCARALPTLAVILVWGGTAAQMLAGVDINFAQIGMLYVVGMVALNGSRVWVLLTGLSIALGSVLGTYYIVAVDSWISNPLFRAMESNGWPSNKQVLAVFAVVISVMTLPWLLGLLFRLFTGRQSAERSTVKAKAEAEGALELARLRAENAALARDVHDVVGHSLAVIIAQADSIRFIPDADVARIRETTGTIADAARRSLGEVRQVLNQTAESQPLGGSPMPSEALQTAQLGLVPPSFSDISGILHGVRTTGYVVTEEMLGQSLPLPAHILPVIRRVIQEMLANALHHGTENTDIGVRHYWGASSYTLSVTNDFCSNFAATRVGTGISGMRERLASVGGTLSIDTDDGAGGVPGTFTIAATFPLNREWV
jgi:signal transduction histidine kinase